MSTSDFTSELNDDIDSLRGRDTAPDSTPMQTRRVQHDPLPPPPSTVEEETLTGWLVRAGLSILVGIASFAIVAGIVAAIIVPPWYRSLEPRYQVIWCNRISLLCDLKAERPEDDVYAFAGGDDVDVGASALLATATFTLSPTLDMPTATATIEPTATTIASTATHQPTFTPAPTDTATPIPTMPPTPTPVPLPQIATLQLDQLQWEQQGWNNCGPTTVTIGLTYFGFPGRSQRVAANYLKPNVEDTNVSPDQMVSFVNDVASLDHDVQAIYRVGGTTELIKILIANNFPVIVERGIIVEDSGWMGHYSLIVGYDDTTDEFLLFDSNFGYAGGEGRRYAQEFIREGWQQFNYTFIVLYSPNRETRMYELLGEYGNETAAANTALNIARQEAVADPDNKWAWFNMGTSFTLLGNYEDAAVAYDRARQLDLPFRMLWYQFGPYIAYYQTGRHDDVLSLALASERTTPYVEETYYYRGLVYAAQGQADSAIFQFDRALSYNENFALAREAKQAVLEGRFRAPT